MAVGMKLTLAYSLLKFSVSSSWPPEKEYC
jgi:hypothetical protein